MGMVKLMNTFLLFFAVSVLNVETEYCVVMVKCSWCTFGGL
jgi:hypothetical protein